MRTVLWSVATCALLLVGCETERVDVDPDPVNDSTPNAREVGREIGEQSRELGREAQEVGEELTEGAQELGRGIQEGFQAGDSQE